MVGGLGKKGWMVWKKINRVDGRGSSGGMESLVMVWKGGAMWLGCWNMIVNGK